MLYFAGASFKLPQSSKREEVAMRLSNRASQSIRKRNQPPSGRITKSSSLARLGSPSLRLSTLSPAAQHLLKRSDRTPTSDTFLRASYASSTAERTRDRKPTSSFTPKRP
ncbi:hypothetical protein BC938DRAFT_474463 [Jimgerdemannia flammicorona]|uniref:Uncharacterized protein n=1 Tax=Jimgerdemannia flammicorona TaxID=994334 RepID=A0A433Q245_9FUNG|nr:hypothetical protein BC938DRAFT_474463 [Jimgerdemannia flammicorona]